MRTRGRSPTKKPRILELRALTREDLLHLQPGKPRAVTGAVQRFRETHHRVARLVALGMRNEQIADATGYSLQRIYTLRATPAFEELVACIKPTVTAEFEHAYDDYRSTAVRNMLRAERHIEEHFEQADAEGSLVPMKLALAVASDRADRFGYGKHTTQTNINVDFAKRLEKAQAVLGKSSVIDAKATHPVAAPAPKLTLVQSPAGPIPSAQEATDPQASHSRAEFGAQLKSLATSMGLRKT